MKKKIKNKSSAKIVLPDIPILYTDNINMFANDDGVILNFTQRIDEKNAPEVVARIGMSREHAKKFISKLTGLLLNTDSNLNKKGKELN